MTVPHLPNIDLFLPSLPMLGFSLKPWFRTFGCSVEGLQTFILDVVDSYRYLFLHIHEITLYLSLSKLFCLSLMLRFRTGAGIISDLNHLSF